MSIWSGGRSGLRLHTPTPHVYMQTMPNTRSLSRFAKAAVSLEVFLSVGALGGGSDLMLGARGEIIPLPLLALKGSPFETYFAPGLILFLVLGLRPLAAAQLAWRRHPLAPIAALGVGVTADLDGGRDRHRWLHQQPTASAVLLAPRSYDHKCWAGLADQAQPVDAPHSSQLT